MYQVIARRYRPKLFGEVIGQEHITEVLRAAIVKDREAHAYLFSGIRGTGKTSTARILAAAMNCETARGNGGEPCRECEGCTQLETGLLVRELDAASNRGIDDMRGLLETSRFASGDKKRVYIIDEAHALTRDSVNAFLKSLEEPQSHIRFVFATTEEHKILPTFLSRCQVHRFKPIGPNDMIELLSDIVAAEEVKVEAAALEMIARASGGSVRDAESILDGLLSLGTNVTVDQVRNRLGWTDGALLDRFVSAVEKQDVHEGLACLREHGNTGGAPELFCDNAFDAVSAAMTGKRIEEGRALAVLDELSLGASPRANDIVRELAVLKACSVGIVVPDSGPQETTAVDTPPAVDLCTHEEAARIFGGEVVRVMEGRTLIRTETGMLLDIVGRDEDAVNVYYILDPDGLEGLRGRSDVSRDALLKAGVIKRKGR